MNKQWNPLTNNDPLEKSFPLLPSDRRMEELIAEVQAMNDKLDKLIEATTVICKFAAIYMEAKKPKVKAK